MSKIVLNKVFFSPSSLAASWVEERAPVEGAKADADAMQAAEVRATVYFIFDLTGGIMEQN